MSTATDYKPAKVQDSLVSLLKKRKGEATCADLVALTGLPTYQVQAELPAVADEYGARLKVTSSGEILYSFPDGMKSRYRGLGPSLKRGWKAFKKGLIAAASFLFKIWIVGMLVGYFVLFVALIILALLASVAVSMSGKGERDRDSGGGLGGLFLAGRLIDVFVRIWFYSELFKSPEQRDYEYHKRSAKRANKRPLYKAVFSFVLGDGDPNADWESVEKKAVVAFLQANKGIMTLQEFMAITGLGPLEADRRINTYLLEFEGEPEVSEAGTIYYSFAKLLRRKDKADRTMGGTVPMKRLEAFSSNPAKANRTFAFFNGFNLLLGGYFAGMSLAFHPLLERLYQAPYDVKLILTGGFDGFYLFVHQVLGKLLGVANPGLGLGIGLGLVPLVFSVLFYLVPALRKLGLDRRNEGIKVENLRRITYRSVITSPAAVRPEAVALQAAAAPAASPKDGAAAQRILVELAAATGGEARADGTYAFEEVGRIEAEASKARLQVKDSDSELGATIFDSHS